jgi:hypothetical protein
MKYIYIILTLLFSNIVKSQTIIDITNTTYSSANNTYYNYYKKDLNNLLDPFQGTYIYTNGNNSFKIVLKKMIKQSVGLHYEDLIIGEYQYIVNGVEKINTLSNIDIIYSNQFLKHNIAGNGIIANINSRVWKCPQCNPNEKRLRLVLEDKISGKNSDFYMRRTIVNGQEIMQLKINNISNKIINVDDPSTQNELPFALPSGELTMIKQ